MGPKINAKDYCYSCGRDRSNCIHSTILKSGGALRARRVEAASIEKLNLTSLGVYQKPKYPSAFKKMNNIQIEFKTLDERLKFEAQFKLTQEFYQARLSHYDADVRDITSGKLDSGVSLIFIIFPV